MRTPVLLSIAVGSIACGKISDLGFPCHLQRSEYGGVVVWQEIDGGFDLVSPGTGPGATVDCSTRMCTLAAGTVAPARVKAYEPAVGACSMQCSSDGDCTPQLPVIYPDAGRGPVAGRCALPRLAPGTFAPYQTKYCFYGG